MSQFLRNKSLFVLTSIVIAVLLVTVNLINALINYNEQKKSYWTEMERMNDTISGFISVDYAEIQKARDLFDVGKITGNDIFELLQHKLDALAEHDLVSNTYLYTPNIITVKDTKQAIVLQSSTGLAYENVVPGTKFELHPAVVTAYETALAQGNAKSDIYNNEIGTWITYYKVIKNPNGDVLGVFGADFDYGSIDNKLTSMFWKSILISMLLAVLFIAVFLFLLRIIIKPINALAQVASHAAEGDLTRTVAVKGQNEIGKLASGFNHMISSLRQLTGNIQHTSEDVSTAANVMQTSSQQTTMAAHEVASAVQEVAANADQQLQSFQECQRAIYEMTLGIQRIAESSSNASELALDAADLAAKGELVIEETLQQMTNIAAHVTDTSMTLHELKAQSDQVNDILALIGDVATQTNLLSLNASIEAARAGEHGKGFAVVAHEIRALAERSKEALDQVSDILSAIGARTEDAVAAMDKSAAAAQVGSAVSGQAGESFRSIVDSIRNVSTQVQEVSAATEQMSASSEQITASLESLEHSSAQSASNAQRAAEASSQQLLSIQEIAGSSEQLQQLAGELNKSLQRFKV